MELHLLAYASWGDGTTISVVDDNGRHLLVRVIACQNTPFIPSDRELDEHCNLEQWMDDAELDIVDGWTGRNFTAREYIMNDGSIEPREAYELAKKIIERLSS